MDQVKANNKVDMFSLGVILYNMLYKNEIHPYAGEKRNYSSRQEFFKYVFSKQS